jgi:hypothetical protein
VTVRVLFIALGANRRAAVVEDSRQLVEAGGRPVVLVSQPGPWADDTFAPGVAVVPLSELAGRHWPMRAEQLLLFRGPSFVLRRVAGRGTQRADRLVAAYRRRVANRVHRRLFLPAYGRLWLGGEDRELADFLRDRGPFEAIVVADAHSFPLAQRILARLGGAAPRVAFRIDQLLNPVRDTQSTTADHEDRG